MSLIKCKCGNILHDRTDYINCKGYVISDKEYFDMLDLADKMIESTNPDREELAMSFRMNISFKDSYIKLKHIFQCPACGRVLLENNKGELRSFYPEDSDDKAFLDYKGDAEIKYAKRNKL